MLARNTGLFDTVIPKIDGSATLILVEEAVSIVSFVLIMILFWWTFLSFQSSSTYTYATVVSGYKLKYLCLLTLLSFFFMSFISAMLMSNMVTQHLSLEMCQIIYPLYFTFYNLGKISIYCLLSFRQQLMFNHDLFYFKKLAISPFASNTFRILCIFIPSSLWSLFIYLGFQHIELITIPNPGAHNQDYKCCAMRVFDSVFFAQALLALIGVCDTVFRLIALWVFIKKCVKMSMYYKQNINAQKHDIITKLTKLMRKTNLLDIMSIFCTLLFLVCSAYIFQQLIYFLIIDAVICSVCIIAMFQFGNQLYLATCFRCEPICICLYCLEKSLNQSTINTKGYQTFQEELLHKTSLHLKDKACANGFARKHNHDTEVHTTSGVQAGAPSVHRKNTINTSTYITVLSGSDEHVEPKDLEASRDEQCIANRRHSSLSISDFL